MYKLKYSDGILVFRLYFKLVILFQTCAFRKDTKVFKDLVGKT